MFKKKILLSLIIGFTPLINSQLPQPETAEQQVNLEKYITEIQKLQGSIYKLQRRISDPENNYNCPKEVLEAIASSRAFLDDQLTNQYVYNNEKAVAALMSLSINLADYLENCLKRVKTPTIEEALRSAVLDIKLEDAYNKLLQINTRFQEFANDYGRTRLQKVIQKAENFENKYNLTRKAFITTSSLVGLGFILYKAGIFKDLNLIGDPSDDGLGKLLKKSPEAIKQATSNLEASKLNQLLPAGISLAVLEKIGVFKISTKPIYEICINDLLKDGFNGGKRIIGKGKNKLRKIYKKMGGSVSENESQGMWGPRYTFNDVSGLEAIKAEIKKSLLIPIERGIKNDLDFAVPHGWLFKGNSRSGKSYLAEAVAGELQKIMPNVNFWNVTANDVKQIGFEGILKYAKYFAPCVVFLDEIDLWQLNRNGNTPNTHLNDLLINLSSLNDHKTKKPVIVIGATNLADKLDPALRQPGRFEREIEFSYPTEPERLEYLVKLLEKERINLELEIVKIINSRLYDQPFEAIKTCVSYAIQLAGTCPPQFEHFITAIDEQVYGIKPYGINNIEKDELQMVASYQAGKLFAQVKFNPKEDIARVTMLPVRPRPNKDCKDNSTYTHMGDIFTVASGKKVMHTHEQMLAEAKILIAGLVGQELVLGSSTPHYRPQDQVEALQILTKIAANGVQFEKLPKKVQEELEAQAFAHYNDLKVELKQMLNEHKEKIVQAAQLILKQGTIDGLELKILFMSSEEQKQLISMINGEQGS